MNPLASTKCAGRLLMALAAFTSILLIAGCGNSSSTSTNPEGFTNASLTGTYVISMSGTDINSSDDIVPFAIVGTITSTGNGTLTGTIDIDDPGNIGVVPGVVISSSSNSAYSVGKDGRGTGTLNVTINSTAVSFGIDFVLTTTSHGLISRFDGFGTGSGTMDLQTSVTGLTGSYAFSLSGADSSGAPLATVGAFTIAGNGGLTGTQDFNDNNSSNQLTDLSVTGALTFGTPATLTLTTTAGQLGFDAWVIDSTHLKFIETDLGGNVLSGDAFTQATTFPAGQVVFTVGGQDEGLNPVAAGGYATAASNGTLSSGVEDWNNSINNGNVPSFGGSCTTFVAGRCQLATTAFTNGRSGNLTFAAYPFSSDGSNGVLLLEDDSLGLALGAALAQSATSFTASGGYGLNLSGLNNLQNTSTGVGEVDNIAQFVPTSAASPATNMTGNLDENDIGAPQPTSTLTGTYTPDSSADGRGSISATNSNTLFGGFNLQYYVVDSATVLFIDVDSETLDGGAYQVALGAFEGQNSGASATAAHRAISMLHQIVRLHGAMRHKK
jgi:hypothetical protein